MIRVLPFAIEAIVLVFCLIDVIMAGEPEVRNLPKWAWILIIILLPVIGGIAWLIAGRPNAKRADKATWRTGDGFSEERRPSQLRPRAPDDDPEFLASLKADNADHERMLKQWEEDLRRREEELRSTEDQPDDPEAPSK